MADQVFRAGDALRREQQVGAEYVAQSYTVTPVSAAVANGSLFIGDSGALSLALAGNVRARLTNPAGSGKTCSASPLSRRWR